MQGNIVTPLYGLGSDERLRTFQRVRELAEQLDDDSALLRGPLNLPGVYYGRGDIAIGLRMAEKPLILGFALSGVVRAVVSKRQMSRLLADDSPRSLAIACLLGAASSSCSYAAVALARSLFRKGRISPPRWRSEFASTNLVAELAIILIVRWDGQFMVAKFAGALLMVATMARVFTAKRSPLFEAISESPLCVASHVLHFSSILAIIVVPALMGAADPRSTPPD